MLPRCTLGVPVRRQHIIKQASVVGGAVRNGATERPRTCAIDRAEKTTLCGELLCEVLVNVFGLPVGNAHLFEDCPARILHEEGRWCALRVGDLEIFHTRRLLLDKVLDGWVVPHASLANVERRRGIDTAGARHLLAAAAAALRDERVRRVDKLSELRAQHVLSVKTCLRRAGRATDGEVRALPMPRTFSHDEQTREGANPNSRHAVSLRSSATQAPRRSATRGVDRDTTPM